MAVSTQKRQAVGYVRAVRSFLTDFNLEEFQELVEITQNPGESNDGSISEGEWLKLKAVQDALCSLEQALVKPAAEYGLVRSALDE